MPGNTDIIDNVVSSQAYKDVVKFQEAIELLNSAFVKTAQSAEIANAAISGATGVKSLQTETAKLNTENEQLLKLEKEIANTSAKRAIAESELGKRLAEEKVLLQQLNKENKNRATLAQTTTGSLSRYDAVIIKLQASQRALNLTTEEGQRKSELYKKAIYNLSTARKKDSDSIKQQQLNVGNYVGSAKIIVEALERERKKLGELQQARTNVQNAGASPLSSRTVIQGFGAGNTTAQLASLDKQIENSRKIIEGFGKVTENPKFLNLSGKVGDSVIELKTLTKSLIELERNGFGDTDAAKKLRAELGKLQDSIRDTKDEIRALSSDTRKFDLFAGSVSFAADAFQTYAGASQLFGGSQEDAAKITATLTAITAVSNGVKGIANELTTRGTAANKVFTAVQKQVNIVMKEGIFTLKGFKAALAATGIGLLIVGVIELVSNLDIFSSSSDKAKEAADKLTESLAEQKRTIDEVNQSLDDDNKIRLEKLKQKGASEADLFNQELETKQKQLDNLKKLEEDNLIKRGENEKKYVETVNKLKPLNFGSVKFSRLTDLKKQQEEEGVVLNNAVSESIKERSKKEAELTLFKEQNITKITLDSIEKRKKYIEDANKKTGDSVEARKKQAEDLAKLNAKLSADELKALQEQKELKLRQAGDVFKRIADDEKKSLQERLIANGFYYGTIEKAANDAAANEKANLISTTIAAKEEILKRKLNKDERSDISIQVNNQLVEIEKQAQDKIDTIHRDGIANQNQLLEYNIAKRLEILAKGESGEVSRINKEESEALTALEYQFNQKLITHEQYEIERTKIEADAAKKRLNAELNTAIAILEIMKATGQDVSEQESKIAEIRLKIARGVTDTLNNENKKQQQSDLETAQKKKELYKELGQQVKETIFSFVDAGFEKQKNALEREKILVDERKDAELKRINLLNISEADKADKIKILDANVQAQKEQIVRRQKQIDIQKAKADKAKAIFDIGIATAVGIIKVVPNPVLIALVAAIGALQLAAVIARPIPEYYTGTNDSKGGPVWLGERGKELLITPDNKVFETPGTATLANIPEHSKVINNSDYVAMLKNNEINAVLKANRPLNEQAFLQWQMKQAENHTQQVVDAIRNKPEAVLNISPYGISAFKKNEHSWQEYIDKKIRFKN